MSTNMRTSLTSSQRSTTSNSNQNAFEMNDLSSNKNNNLTSSQNSNLGTHRPIQIPEHLLPPAQHSQQQQNQNQTQQNAEEKQRSSLNRPQNFGSFTISKRISRRAAIGVSSLDESKNGARTQLVGIEWDEEETENNKNNNNNNIDNNNDNSNDIRNSNSPDPLEGTLFGRLRSMSSSYSSPGKQEQKTNTNANTNTNTNSTNTSPMLTQSHRPIKTSESQPSYLTSSLRERKTTITNTTNTKKNTIEWEYPTENPRSRSGSTSNYTSNYLIPANQAKLLNDPISSKQNQQNNSLKISSESREIHKSSAKKYVKSILEKINI